MSYDQDITGQADYVIDEVFFELYKKEFREEIYLMGYMTSLNYHCSEYYPEHTMWINIARCVEEGGIKQLKLHL
jgi:hypothetical protein